MRQAGTGRAGAGRCGSRTGCLGNGVLAGRRQLTTGPAEADSFLLTRGFHLGDAFKIVPRVPVATVDGTRRSGLSGRSNWRAASANKTASTAAQAEPELFGDAEAPQEYTRTSSLRSPAGKSSSFGQSQADWQHKAGNRLSHHPQKPMELRLPVAGHRFPARFQSSFRRARPWARNDADPSDE